MSHQSQQANPAAFTSATSHTTTTSTGTSLSSSSPLHRPRCGHSQEGLKQLGAARFLDDDQCCRIKLRDHGTGNLITCGALFSEHPRWDHPTPQIQPTNSTPSIQHSSTHRPGPRSDANSSAPSSQLKYVIPSSDNGSGLSHDLNPISSEKKEQADRSIDDVARDDQSIQAALGTGPNTKSEFYLRAATADDIDLILQFIKELAEYEKLLNEVVATTSGLQQTLFGAKHNAEVILAYFNEQPIGFALFFHNYSTFLGKPGLYIEDLYVKSEMRGKGFGQRMLTFLAALAKERNCGRLEWWVLDWNEAAVRFYKKLGAQPMSDWTVYRVTGTALDSLASEYIASSLIEPNESITSSSQLRNVSIGSGPNSSATL